jgi:hypothetical protein
MSAVLSAMAAALVLMAVVWMPIAVELIRMSAALPSTVLPERSSLPYRAPRPDPALLSLYRSAVPVMAVVLVGDRGRVGVYARIVVVDGVRHLAEVFIHVSGDRSAVPGDEDWFRVLSCIGIQLARQGGQW